MTRIHMETENVSQIARELNLAALALEHLPSQINNLSQGLSSAWEGDNVDYYVREISHTANDLQEELENLQGLASQVSSEINQWEAADNNGARNIRYDSWALLPSGGLLASTLPLLGALRYPSLPPIDTQLPSGEAGLIKSWEGGLDVTYANKWTRNNGWENDADASLGAKVRLFEGAYAEGDASSNWRVGNYDIGGTVGQYGVSQGQAGVEFGVGENGFTAGAYGEYDLVEASGGAVLGSALLGLTFSTAGSAGSADGFVGYKNGTVGASVGASAVAGEIGLGVNVAGANVGVSAGLGLGFELGIKLGADTEIKAGPFKIGLSFGKAITD